MPAQPRSSLVAPLTSKVLLTVLALLKLLFLLYWIFGPKPVVIRQKFPSRQPEPEPQRADDVIDVTAVDVTEPEKQPLLKEDDHAR